MLEKKLGKSRVLLSDFTLKIIYNIQNYLFIL